MSSAIIIIYYYVCVYIPCASKSSIIMLSACLGVISAISFAFESSFFVVLLVPLVAFLFGMFTLPRKEAWSTNYYGGRGLIKWLLLGLLLLELDLLACVL